MRKRKPSRRSALSYSGGQKRGRGRPRERRIHLQSNERVRLHGMTRRGTLSVRVMKRAQVLLMLDSCQSTEDVGKSVGLSTRGIDEIVKRYRKGGLKESVEEPTRPGRKRAINSREEGRLVAMLCGPSPQGRGRWTVRLASEEAAGQGICKAKRETIRVFMKERSIKPWRKKNVVHRGEDT